MPSSRLIQLAVFSFVSLAANVVFAAVPIPKPPAIDARSYVLVDFQSGRVLAEYKVSQLGLAWYPAWPPVIGMEFEVDVRCVRTELVTDAR